MSLTDCRTKGGILMMLTRIPEYFDNLTTEAALPINIGRRLGRKASMQMRSKAEPDLTSYRLRMSPSMAKEKKGGKFPAFLFSP